MVGYKTTVTQMRPPEGRGQRQGADGDKVTKEIQSVDRLEQGRVQHTCGDCFVEDGAG